MPQCKNCGSCAINHNHYGRDGTDPNLCDACYWRTKAERSASDVKRLREWIREEGERNNTCTFNVLGDVCGYCECKRKHSNNRNEGLSKAVPLD